MPQFKQNPASTGESMHDPGIVLTANRANPTKQNKNKTKCNKKKNAKSPPLLRRMSTWNLLGEHMFANVFFDHWH